MSGDLLFQCSRYTQEYSLNSSLKLVLIKAKRDSLKAISHLDTFEGQDPTSEYHNSFSTPYECISVGIIAPCTNVNDLEHSYELSQAKIAFSIASLHETGLLTRYTDTTAMSNEIHESKHTLGFFQKSLSASIIAEQKSKGSPADRDVQTRSINAAVLELTCPNCSHEFSVEADDSNPRKRSASPSASTQVSNILSIEAKLIFFY